MIKVSELVIGDKVKLGRIVVHVRGIKGDGIYVSKQPTGNALFSIDRYSPKFDDLENRVELAA